MRFVGGVKTLVIFFPLDDFQFLVLVGENGEDKQIVEGISLYQVLF